MVRSMHSTANVQAVDPADNQPAVDDERPHRRPNVYRKSWRAKSRKQKPLHAVQTIIAIIEGVRPPQEIAREKRRRRIIPLPE